MDKTTYLVNRLKTRFQSQELDCIESQTIESSAVSNISLCLEQNGDDVFLKTRVEAPSGRCTMRVSKQRDMNHGLYTVTQLLERVIQNHQDDSATECAHRSLNLLFSRA